MYSLIFPIAYLFQLTRSRGAWPLRVQKLLFYNVFQLTRSRGAWHGEKRKPWKYWHISTHTLTWSVTLQLSSQWLHCQISTHTLTWSVTCRFLLFTVSELFQLTRSRGAWPNGKTYAVCEQDFNSHAHVERDSLNHHSCYYHMHFNSHAHVERDVTV